MEAQSVVVILDASNEVNTRVFTWALKSLAFKPGDKLTVVLVLYQINTPMGYKSFVDHGSMLGANKRIIEIEAAKRMEMYQNNEELVQIAEMYESEKVEFNIQLVTGPSPKEVALKTVIELKSTWVIIDRKMKKDGEYFLKNLSCAISRLKRHNRIEHLRGPRENTPPEYNSQETYDDSNQDYQDEEFSMEAIPKSQIKGDQMTQEQSSAHKEENDSSLTINDNQNTSQIVSDQLSQDQEDSKENIHDEYSRLTLETKDDLLNQNQEQQRTSYQDLQDGQNIHDEYSGLTLETKDDLLNQNQEQQRTSYQDLQDGQQENSMLGSSKCSICSVCKIRRPNIGWQKDFSYKELQAATDGFSIENSLSEGGHGPIFKGRLEGKLEIVIKQHQITDPQVEKNIKLEVQLALNARHKNVAMLLGSSREESHLLIVYEYACNGSLDKYLSNESCRSLTWRQRVKVAMGCCRGLKFLHENKIIHGSIKPSNILLTHDFEPLLGDISFGNAKRESKKSHGDKNSGYIAPEFLENGKLSTKTDVYSIGVVLLELITGRRATDKISGGKILVVWAKQYLGGKKYPQLVDPKIINSYEEDQLLSLVRVTEQCLKKNPKERLSMNMVVSALQGISDSEECCVIEESLPGNSYSKCSLPHITGSQGQTKVDQLSLDEKQMQSRPHGDERSRRQMISNHQKIGETKADQPSQVEHQMHSSFHADERSSRPMVCNNHVIGEIKEDLLNQDQKKMKSSSHQDLLDRYQGEIIVENSKCVACSICKSRRPNIGWQKDFTYKELQAATDGFSNENSLSEGGYGPAFKGQLEGKLKIVVKQRQISDPQVEKNIKSEVQSLLQARHKNVVLLLGSSRAESQLLIVYEYVCNGSLAKYLSKESCKPFTWRQRVKVAMGCCRGLKFLHENNIIHGSIKPSNILLTHDFEPLLGDFSFAKAEHALKKTYADKNSGYIAPELQKSRKFSNKTDVYSFGVILLELITGQRATDKLSGGKSLVEWAKPFLGGKKYPQVVDPKISSSYEDGQLLSLVKVTEECLRKNPKKRSSMNMVVSALQGIADGKECYVIEDSPPANPYSTCSVQGINGSQDQTKADQLSQDEEQKQSRMHREERSQQPMISNNHMIGQTKADQLSQDEEQMQSRSHREERSLRQTVSNVSDITSSQGDEESHYVSGVITSPGDEESHSVSDIISSQGNEESHCVSDVISSQGDEESLYVSDITSSQADGESLTQEELKRKVSQEKEKCITCDRSNKETEISQESKNYVTCGASTTKTQEKESLSTGMSQKSEKYTSYGGANRFFLGGAETYIVDEEFFSLSSF